jgi:hypothetical protein
VELGPLSHGESLPETRVSRKGLNESRSLAELGRLRDATARGYQK